MSHEPFLTGRTEAPDAQRILRAGPVTAILEGADLRHVRIGPVELVQRVYVAVRDAPWNTIPAAYGDWEIDARDDRFTVAFTAQHRHEAIAFAWRGRIEGTPDGRIRYEMDGVCEGAFKYSKIGFNVHHGLDGSVGRPYRAQTTSGELRGRLPVDIGPQRVIGGTLSGMFDPYRELAIEVVDGTESVVSLEGDLLELQDHRNWTDANFKSYATPLVLGFPFDSTPGGRIRQILTIGWVGRRPTDAPDPAPRVTIGPPTRRALPAIGFGMASHGQPFSEREARLIRATAPAHLRVDVDLRDPEAVRVLEAGARAAAAVGAGIELALFLNETLDQALDRLAALISTLEAPVVRILTFHASEGFSPLLGTTPASLVRLVRERLEPVVGPIVVAGGTNQSFGDVNRDRPGDPALGGLAFSICPTVHAADDGSIVENLIGQAEVVRMARSFPGDRPIVVSPVTIATRFGPYPAGPARPGDLPPAVDPRQASLLGAGWTVGSVGRLAASGAASVTYYETTGWRGLVERDAGNPMPECFPSSPGDVFPLYHVFADLAEWQAGALVKAASSDPLVIEALVVDAPDGRHALIANLTRDARTVVIGPATGSVARVRLLDLASVAEAMADPGAFRERSSSIAIEDGRIEFDLGPFATARVDLPGEPV